MFSAGYIRRFGRPPSFPAMGGADRRFSKEPRCSAQWPSSL